MNGQAGSKPASFANEKPNASTRRNQGKQPEAEHISPNEPTKEPESDFDELIGLKSQDKEAAPAPKLPETSPRGPEANKPPSNQKIADDFDFLD